MKRRHTYSRVVLSCLVICIKVLVFASSVQGDGLLSQIRDEVYDEENQEQRRDKKRSKKNNGVLQQVVEQVIANDDHEEHQHKRRRRRKRRPTNHLNFVAFEYPVYSYGPPTRFVCAPQPVIVERSCDVYDPIVGEPPPIAVSEYPSAEESCDLGDHDWFTEWSARLTATGGGDFDNVSNFGMALLLQTTGRLGLDTSVTTLRENRMSFRDHLWLGDVNLMFEPISQDNLRGRLGIGVNWLGDNVGGEAGFNLTGGFDFKMNDFWLLVGEGDIGTLGDSDFFHGEISLVRRFDTAGLVLGFEYYDIGGVEINSFVTGLEFRF